jgi:hypothetical protein
LEPNVACVEGTPVSRLRMIEKSILCIVYKSEASYEEERVARGAAGGVCCGRMVLYTLF